MKWKILIVFLAIFMVGCATVEVEQEEPTIQEPVTEEDLIEEDVDPIVQETSEEINVVFEEETVQGITRDEIAQNSDANSCWVAWRGEVYDLTSWLRQHPGGAPAILPYCGTVEEFEAAFQERHNSGGTRDDGLLRNEPIGVLA